MNTRSWPIRTKLFALVLIPVISLIALWGVATSMAYDSARDLITAQTGYDEATKPTEALVGRLQQERRLSVAFLGSPRADGRGLAALRAETDTAAAAFRTHATGSRLRSTVSATVRTRIDKTRADLVRLAELRQGVDSRQLDRAAAFRAYTDLVDGTFQIFLAMPGVNHPAVSVDAHAVVAAARAREALSQEDAMLAGIAVAGRFTGQESAQLAGAIGAQRFLFADAVPGLARADRDAYTRILHGDEANRLRALEERLLTDARAGGPVPVDMAAWQSAYDPYAEQLSQAEYAAIQAVMDRARPIGVDIMVRLGLLGVLGLIAIICSMVVAHRLGASMVGRLTRLRDLTRELASNQLPAITRRLRAGEPLDLAREVQSPDFGSDEVCQVGRAVFEIHRAAVESVGNEARMRAGVNKVFLNVARRSQTLLHRQLTLLDQMERDTVDPGRLQALFRIDHLATRMRRHAEDLVILAGSSPARGWRTPVSIIDVIRGAISEVEDYTRITLHDIPEVAVAGPAVADVIHLLSELLENASAFSPPHTPVLVSGQLVPSGLAIDIEDRGLGMPADAVEEANGRLANPPEFDPANSTRLGLFVVATLAARHHIGVNLRRSPYGGITAVVLLPPELIMDDPAGPGTGLAVDHAAALEAFAGRADVPAGPVTNGRSTIGSGRNRLGWGRGPGGPVAADTALAPPTTAIPGVGSIVVPSRQGEPVRDAPTAAPQAGQATRPEEDPASGDAGAVPEAVDPHAPTAEYAVVEESPTVELTTDGLPRRRRQASLAPQLRGGQPSDRLPAPGRSPGPAQAPAGRPAAGSTPETGQDPDGAPGPDGVEGAPDPGAPHADRQDGAGPAAGQARRSPEQVRSLMSALQSGTRRGRQAADEFLRTSQEIAQPAPPQAQAQTQAQTQAPAADPDAAAAAETPAVAATPPASTASEAPTASTASTAPANQDAPGDEEEQ